MFQAIHLPSADDDRDGDYEPDGARKQVGDWQMAFLLPR